ncbi:MAG: helix-turn-helix transcriptional regulator [Bacilli bacterium]|jgi:transcriptional regulator with XRE-family HTH domain
MDFNQKLKTLREGLGLTQEELALRLNVSRSAIAKWEQGQGWPSLDLLKSLALFFHTSIDELLGEQGVKMFDRRQKKRFGILTAVAIVALALTMASTTWLIIELKRAQTPVLTSEIICLDAVSLIDDRYTVSYTQDEEEKTLSFDWSLVTFRNLDDWSFALNPHDYLAIDRYGEEVRQAVILDNAQSSAIKGYDLIFETTDDEYRYFYHEYMDGSADYPYLVLDSDIPHLEGANTNISNRSIAGQEYFVYAASHTIYADNDLPEDMLMGFALKPISMAGVDGDPIVTNYHGGLNRIRSLRAKFQGYLNHYAYEGSSYSIRDLVSFDVTIEFVASIDVLTVRQYDESDALVAEDDILDISDIETFSIEEEAAYLKYYIDGSARGRTLETGENETFFIENGTPLVTVFNLCLDTDY